MTTQIRTETDALNADEVATLKDGLSNGTCNGFAFSYVEDVNPDATVIVGEMSDGTEHCFVHDPDFDAVIDATMTQLRDADVEAAAFDGRDHPLCDEVWSEWTDRDAFREHFSQHGMANSPFHFWD